MCGCRRGAMHGRMGCAVSRPMGLRLVESLAQDRADGAGAASTLRAAAQAAVDLSGGAGTARPRLQARAYLSVGEDVARADDHAGYRKPVVPVGSRPRQGRRSPGLSDHSYRPWPGKPADLGRSQIRMIEKSKLFRTLAAGRATGQERTARFISAQSVAGSRLPFLVRDEQEPGTGPVFGCAVERRSLCRAGMRPRRLNAPSAPARSHATGYGWWALRRSSAAAGSVCRRP